MRPSPANGDSNRIAHDALRAARSRRMAWALGAIVLVCYIGFMVMTRIKGAP